MGSSKILLHDRYVFSLTSPWRTPCHGGTNKLCGFVNPSVPLVSERYGTAMSRHAFDGFQILFELCLGVLSILSILAGLQQFDPEMRSALRSVHAHLKNERHYSQLCRCRQCPSSWWGWSNSLSRPPMLRHDNETVNHGPRIVSLEAFAMLVPWRRFHNVRMGHQCHL